MIRRIRLVNFMSHVHTVIEPADGLTVLVGPNNCGKSAVVTALQILCHNENSTYVTRHNERECSVKIETDDGHVIEWRRRNSPSYTVDGVPFDRLGRSGSPDELHDVLRLPKVSAEGNQEFDVHFGEQKSPVFLLDKPGSHAAQFFASSSDAALLVEMQKRHQQKSADARKERTKLDVRFSQLATELANFAAIDAIEPNLAEIEEQYENLQKSTALIQSLSHDLDQLQKVTAELEHRHSQSMALAKVTAPPAITDPQSLKSLIQQLAKTERDFDAQTNRACALKALQPAPDLEDSLEQLVADLRAQQQRCAGLEKRLALLSTLADIPGWADESALANDIRQLRQAELNLHRDDRATRCLIRLNAPPPIDDPSELNHAIRFITDASKEIARLDKQVAETNNLHAATATELRSAATKQRICPTCGGELDPDRLLNRACFHGQGELFA